MSTTSRANPTNPDLKWEGRSAVRKSQIDAAVDTAGNNFTNDELAAAKRALTKKTA